MFRLSLNLSVGALLVAVFASPRPAAAQTPGHVRVVSSSARIQEWFRLPEPEVLAEVQSGTILEVLDKEGAWFWVVAPRDAHGTRKGGWIRAFEVEAVVPAAASTASTEGERIEPEPPASASAASAAPPTATAADDKVTLRVSRDEPASTRPNAPAPTKVYEFDDVHFDRDRYSLRQEDMDTLLSAVSALRADPALVVRIEGHTCSLGTSEYNLELGMRRADAVKNYLMSAGISADRLRTASRGEEHARHDNSREETRRLNRRVALVPGGQP